MTRTRLLFCLPLLFALAACDPKPGTAGKIANKVNDALDRRPDEKLRDAAEDVCDGVTDAAKDVKK